MGITSPKLYFMRCSDVMALERIGKNAAYNRLSLCRDALGKQALNEKRTVHQVISLEEYCEYFAIDLKAAIQILNDKMKAGIQAPE